MAGGSGKPGLTYPSRRRQYRGKSTDGLHRVGRHDQFCSAPSRAVRTRRDPAVAQQRGDPHLRSASEVAGYYLHATDGDLGHVHDFLIGDEDWAIRYFIVDTRNWWAGKKVLIPTQWIREVNWEQSKVHVDVSRAAIQAAPEYSDELRLSRDFEKKLFDAYRREPYWSQRRHAA